MRLRKNFLNVMYPVLLGLIFLFLKFIFRINFTVKGFEHILESVIAFSSIIIGFYTAMYGVLLTLSNSTLMKEIKKKNLSALVKFQLYDSLICSFVILVISIALQVLKNYNTKITTYTFYIWVFILGYFSATSFRSISLLLNMIFNNEPKKRATSDSDFSDAQKKEWQNKINENN